MIPAKVLDFVLMVIILYKEDLVILGAKSMSEKTIAMYCAFSNLVLRFV